MFFFHFFYSYSILMILIKKFMDLPRIERGSPRFLPFVASIPDDDPYGLSVKGETLTGANEVFYH